MLDPDVVANTGNSRILQMNFDTERRIHAGFKLRPELTNDGSTRKTYNILRVGGIIEGSLTQKYIDDHPSEATVEGGCLSALDDVEIQNLVPSISSGNITDVDKLNLEE